MHYRDLGRTGLRISEVGLGCNRIGEPIASDQEWDLLVKHSLDLGVNIFDTAEVYQKGRSEEVLGRVIPKDDHTIIATKYSPRQDDEGNVSFTIDTVEQALDNSLKRLQREAVDIFQIHSPSLSDLRDGLWHETFTALREKGKIRHIAIAVNRADEAKWLIEQRLVEVLQITYNLIDRAVEERVLDLAAREGVGLLVRKPLSRGVLSGKFHPGQPVPEHHRATNDKDALPGRIELAERFRPLGDAYPGGLTRLAHHFSLSHPAVSCIIPGARNIKQLEENVSASNGFGLPTEIKTQIPAL